MKPAEAGERQGPTEVEIWKEIIWKERRGESHRPPPSEEAMRTMVDEVRALRLLPDHVKLTPKRRLRLEVVIGDELQGPDSAFPPTTVELYDPRDELQAYIGGSDPAEALSYAATWSAGLGRPFVLGHYVRWGDALLEALNRYPVSGSFAANWILPGLLSQLQPPLTVPEFLTLQATWYGNRHGPTDTQDLYVPMQWDSLEDWALECFISYPPFATESVLRLGQLVRVATRRLRKTRDPYFDSELRPVKRLLIGILDGSVNIASPVQFDAKGNRRAPSQLMIQRKCRKWFEQLQLAMIPHMPSVQPVHVDLEHVQRYDSYLKSIEELWKMTEGRQAAELRNEGLREEFVYLTSDHPSVTRFFKACGDLGQAKASDVAARLVSLIWNLNLSPQHLRKRLGEVRRREGLSRRRRPSMSV